jgi:hypothetical protein
VVWGTDGKIVAKLYDSDGVTLIQSVSAVNRWITSGGIAFRATGADKHWDTVTDLPTSPSTLPGAMSRSGSRGVRHHDIQVAGLLVADESSKKSKVQQQLWTSTRDQIFMAGFPRRGF